MLGLPGKYLVIIIECVFFFGHGGYFDLAKVAQVSNFGQFFFPRLTSAIFSVVFQLSDQGEKVCWREIEHLLPPWTRKHLLKEFFISGLGVLAKNY